MCKSVLDNRPALYAAVWQVAETAGYLWEKGWAERNGGNITVNITRKNTGIIDQLCAAGNCVPGNGELTQVCEFKVGTLPFQRSWFTHYTPIEPSTEVIVYTFNDGVNPAIELTIRYSYEDDDTAIEDVIARPNDNAIYNLLGQRMPTTNWEELSAGIYIINGKKYIKK